MCKIPNMTFLQSYYTLERFKIKHEYYISRHISSQHGSNIAYDHNGKILKIEKTARPVGTTVILKDIFSTMPVRVKEFQRNIKKEFAKLCQVLFFSFHKNVIFCNQIWYFAVYFVTKLYSILCIINF